MIAEAGTINAGACYGIFSPDTVRDASLGHIDSVFVFARLYLGIDSDCLATIERPTRPAGSPAPAICGSFARRALQVPGDDPGTLANAGLALAYHGEDIGAMMTLVDRALALNPSFARGWVHRCDSETLCRPI